MCIDHLNTFFSDFLIYFATFQYGLRSYIDDYLCVFGKATFKSQKKYFMLDFFVQLPK